MHRQLLANLLPVIKSANRLISCELLCAIDFFSASRSSIFFDLVYSVISPVTLALHFWQMKFQTLLVTLQYSCLKNVDSLNNKLMNIQCFGETSGSDWLISFTGLFFQGINKNIYSQGCSFNRETRTYIHSLPAVLPHSPRDPTLVYT